MNIDVKLGLSVSLSIYNWCLTLDQSLKYLSLSSLVCKMEAYT